MRSEKTALVLLTKVTFHDGQKLAADLPRNSLDPRYALCHEHRFACDCREAELAEDRDEWRSEFQAAMKVFNQVLAGHRTFADDKSDECKCTGCEIARLTHFRRSWHVRNEREQVRCGQFAEEPPF